MNTKEILDAFFEDCLRFWEKEGKGEEAYKLAIKDIRNISSDPFSPNGRDLDVTEKEEWIVAKTANGMK